MQFCLHHNIRFEKTGRVVLKRRKEREANNTYMTVNNDDISGRKIKAHNYISREARGARGDRVSKKR